MLQLRIGVQLSGLRLPFKQALLTAARMGAEAVEIDVRNGLRAEDLSRTGIRHVRKLLDDFNLKVCAVSYPTRRGYEVLDELDRRVDGTKAAMQLAWDLGCNVVINDIGSIPLAEGSASWENLIQSLSDIGRHGQRCGATLCASTGYATHEHLQRVLLALPDGSLGVNLDPGGIIMNGGSVVEATTALRTHVLHVHARDGVRGLGGAKGEEVPLGRGSIEFPELLGILEQSEYRGYLTVKRERCENPEFEFGQAVEFLNRM